MSVELGGGWERFMSKLDKLGERAREANKEGKNCYVGVLGSAGSDLVVIAAANEYGTEDGRIPSRPFLRNAMNQPGLKPFVQRHAALYTQGKETMDQALNQIGAYSQGLVQRSIGSNIQPANAQSTIARKHSSRTLINTGRLRQSIAWIVR